MTENKSWAAAVLYAEGELGQIAVFGLQTKDDAIKWVRDGFIWELCWHLKPSCRVWQP